jgi:hypothetical protein
MLDLVIDSAPAVFYADRLYRRGGVAYIKTSNYPNL